MRPLGEALPLHNGRAFLMRARLQQRFAAIRVQWSESDVARAPHVIVQRPYRPGDEADHQGAAADCLPALPLICRPSGRGERGSLADLRAVQGAIKPS